MALVTFLSDHYAWLWSSSILFLVLLFFNMRGFMTGKTNNPTHGPLGRHMYFGILFSMFFWLAFFGTIARLI